MKKKSVKAYNQLSASSKEPIVAFVILRFA